MICQLEIIITGFLFCFGGVSLLSDLYVVGAFVKMKFTFERKR